MGICIERTYDKVLIRAILTDPRIWNSISEDGQEVGMFEVDLNKNIFLAVNHKVSAYTQNPALCFILFLYRNVLKKEIGWIDNLEWSKKTKRIPVVFIRKK